MASRALDAWDTARLGRIDQLYDAHSRIEGGDARGRRWRTGQVNRLLVLALVAEFQGYCRDVHDLTVEEFVHRTSFLGSDLVEILRSLLSEDRKLDRGNPGIGELAKDFGRFGINWWSALASKNVRTAARQDHLERMMKARNGIAHADDLKIRNLAKDGFPYASNSHTLGEGALRSCEYHGQCSERSHREGVWR